MAQFQAIENPILNNAYEEPSKYWHIQRKEPPVQKPGRRRSFYFRKPTEEELEAEPDLGGVAVDLYIVNEIRDRVRKWREAGYPTSTGSRATDELLRYWSREDRERKLFFAQREAAETIIFLREARQDFLVGIPEIPLDEPSADAQAKGYWPFTRLAAKMATGSGKTTVMAMIIAWSILNRVESPSRREYSDRVLVVCPNVTIRDRLQELLPERGEASVYRARDLVPSHLMTDLQRGKVIVTNWHVLEPRNLNEVGGVSARVVNRGVESDAALVARILEESGKGNGPVLVINDEAHHAYRRRQVVDEEVKGEEDHEEEEAEEEAREATVWIEGLDRIQKIRGINFCFDLSATPFFMPHSGNPAGTPFPWVVSDFGLFDAIESGIVKIPQLPIADTTGIEGGAYLNIWKWIVEKKLSPGEKGGRRGQVKPEAVLRHAQTAIMNLAGQWRKTFEAWQRGDEGPRCGVPPVFIIVCKDTRLSKVVHEWITGKSESGVLIPEFANEPGKEVTVRIDTSVKKEIAEGKASTKEVRRLRFVLDTVGRTAWPGGQIPEEYIEIAKETGIDPSIPPGRDIRCIVSVGMLTEGWDANNVTHIVGLRPFKSQLLCEQVVGRGLRRAQYDDLSVEEVVTVYGVPFEMIPMKTSPGRGRPPPQTNHVHAIKEREHLSITFPRVEGYITRIRNKLVVNWDEVVPVRLDPTKQPSIVSVKALNLTDEGRRSLLGPGKIENLTLAEWRELVRLQKVEFQLAKVLTGRLSNTPEIEIPPHLLFPQLLDVVQRFVKDKVVAEHGTDKRDILLDPYRTDVLEAITKAIRPDVEAGEAAELPRYERNRRPGTTAEVDFWTAKKTIPCIKSHLNACVADTLLWEQIVTQYLEIDDNVTSFARNVNLGLAIPYLQGRERHDYLPDFLVKLKGSAGETNLILEVKGYDVLAGVKEQAARRWVAAVNADGRHGRWAYAIVRDPPQTPHVLQAIADGAELAGSLQTQLPQPDQYVPTALREKLAREGKKQWATILDFAIDRVLRSHHLDDTNVQVSEEHEGDEFYAYVVRFVYPHALQASERTKMGEIETTFWSAVMDEAERQLVPEKRLREDFALSFQEAA